MDESVRQTIELFIPRTVPIFTVKSDSSKFCLYAEQKSNPNCKIYSEGELFEAIKKIVFNESGKSTELRSLSLHFWVSTFLGSSPPVPNFLTFSCSERKREKHTILGSNPPTPSFFGVLCRAKKRKKYTRIFTLKMKKTGFGTALMLLWSPFFGSKTLKNREKSQKMQKGCKKTSFAVVDKRRFFYVKDVHKWPKTR